MTRCRGFNGVHRTMLKAESFTYTLNVLAVHKNLPGERYYDAKVKIVNGVLFEVDNKFNGVVKHFHSSEEALDYIKTMQHEKNLSKLTIVPLLKTPEESTESL